MMKLKVHYRTYIALLCTTLLLLPINHVYLAPRPRREQGTRVGLGDDLRSAILKFNNALAAYIDVAAQKQEYTYELIGIITENYTMDLSDSASISLESARRFLIRFTEVYPAYIDILLKGFELVSAWEGIYETLESGTRDGDLSDINSTRFFLVASLAVGLGMLGYGLYKMGKRAFDRNAEMSKRIVDDATDSDLQKIRTKLGLPPTATKEEIKNHIDSLPLAQKNIAARDIQELDITASLETSHAYEIRQNQARIARDLGEDGVKWYAGAATTATGGQMVDKIARALGASEGVAATVDMALTLAEKQPLDIVGSTLSVAMGSRSKDTLEVDRPENRQEHDAARTNLEKAVTGSDIDEETLDDAADSIAELMVQGHSVDLNPYERWDGGWSVDVPEKVHLQQKDAPVGKETIQVPDIGVSEMLITTPETAPVSKTSVDPEEDSEIDAELTPLSELGEVSDFPMDIVFCIDLTGSMADDIDQVVSSARTMLLSIRLKTRNYRFGFVGYRDIEEDSVPFERFAFSGDPHVIKANIDSLPDLVYGGGDYPESVYEGLDIAESMPWREDAGKTIILMGDAPPKSSYGLRGRTTFDNLTDDEIRRLTESPPDMDSIVSKAERLDLRIYTIVVADGGYYDPLTQEVFSEIANRTGGTLLRADDAAQVPENVMAALSQAIDQAKVDSKNDGDTSSVSMLICLGISTATAIFLFFIVLILVVVVFFVGRKRSAHREGRAASGQEGGGAAADSREEVMETHGSEDEVVEL